MCPYRMQRLELTGSGPYPTAELRCDPAVSCQACPKIYQRFFARYCHPRGVVDHGIRPDPEHFHFLPIQLEAIMLPTLLNALHKSLDGLGVAADEKGIVRVDKLADDVLPDGLPDLVLRALVRVA